jgi:molecular chaperone GrpE (heat shock protein)
LNEYIDAFETEIKAKNAQLNDAETEIARLAAEVRRYETQVSASKSFTLRAGAERDLYSGETQEIIRDAIEDASERVHHDSRRLHVLKAMLKSLPASGAGRANREKIKDLLRGYRTMDAKVRKGLEGMGFSIEDDGKHYKLIFQGDDRYTYALSKSGSDHRGGLNAASDISKLIF